MTRPLHSTSIMLNDDEDRKLITAYMSDASSKTPDQNITHDLRTTITLKVHITLASLTSITLMILAAIQSRRHIITFGYAPVETDNNFAATINAVVAIYGAATGMATRLSVTKCLELLAVKALSTNGRFIWSARSWAYMSHANGRWYTLGPLFIAGLAATAVISILPIAVIDAGHFVDFTVFPLNLTSMPCWNDTTGEYEMICSGVSTAVSLLQSFPDSSSSGSSLDNEFLTGLVVQGQMCSKHALGYPWDLVNNRLAEYEKYKIPESDGISLRESNKTSCVWVLEKNPVRCSHSPYTVVNQELVVTSPYSGQVYSMKNTSSWGQTITTGTFEKQSEMVMVAQVAKADLFGPETDCLAEYCGYVCMTRDLSEVHVGRYLTTKFNGFVTGTYVDLANSSSCLPNYQLPSVHGVKSIVDDMAGGIFNLETTTGFNTLLESFGNTEAWVNDTFTPLLFDDSRSQFEEGIGAFMALMLSGIYVANSTNHTANFTRVKGGQTLRTVGLGDYNKLYVWLMLVTVPLLTLSIAISMPIDYIPIWDVMNTIDALATPAVIDEDVAASRGRTGDIRLGILDGRIVASNTGLPLRTAKYVSTTNNHVDRNRPC